MKFIRSKPKLIIPLAAALLGSTALTIAMAPRLAHAQNPYHSFGVPNDAPAENNTANPGEKNPGAFSITTDFTTDENNNKSGNLSGDNYYTDAAGNIYHDVTSSNGDTVTLLYLPAAPQPSNNNPDDSGNGDNDNNNDNPGSDDPNQKQPAAANPAAEQPDDGIIGYLEGLVGGDNDPDSGNENEGPNLPNFKAGKSSSVTVKLKGSLQGSPLGFWLDGQGFGFNPHGNPGDNDSGNGPPPPPGKADSGLTRQQLTSLYLLGNAAERAITVLGTSMGTGDEGGTENAPGVNPHNGKGNIDTTGNYSDGQNKLVGKTEKDLLGAKPDVINPPHLNKVGKSTTTGKRLTTTDTNKDSGKTLSVTGAGLLDDGGGVGQNGPAGTGSSGGHIYRGIRDR